MCSCVICAEDLGLRRRRRDAVDQDVSRRELLAERLGEADQPGLRGAVVRGVRVAFLAGDRGDVDDPAVAARDHVRDHGAAGEEAAGQVDVDDAPPDVGIELPGQAVAAGDAGVVDQDVDPSVVRRGRVRGGFDRRRVGQFDVPYRDRPEVPTARAARPPPLSRVDVPETDRGAGLQRAPRRGIADAARRRR